MRHLVDVSVKRLARVPYGARAIRPGKFSPASLNILFSVTPSFKTAREREQALSLIRRIIAKLAFEVDVISLEAMRGGRSSSRVFKTIFAKSRHAPVVIKIGPRADGAREKANYDRFVCSGLAPANRAELLAFAATRDRAALCYSFAEGTTLTEYLQRGDVAKIDLVLSRLFASLSRTWSAPHLIRAQRDIGRYYLERFFASKNAAVKDETALFACAERYFKAKQKGGGAVIGGDWFPSLCKVLFAAERARNWHSCILHGDLNTDNIVIASKDVRLIDYQKTGRGHVFQDMAFLEESVRINYPAKGKVSFAAILETESAIALGQRHTNKQPSNKDPYVASIRNIRAAAARTFGRVENETTWNVAIAALGLRLMQATDLTHIARARITASALWAAKVLAE